MRRVAGTLAATALFACSLAAAPPDPSTFLGHPLGQDRTPVEWSQVTAYFRALAESNDRVRVIEYGRSTEGHPMIAAIVSAEGNLKRLDRFQEIQRRLSDPRATQPGEADKLFAEGRAIVLITCSVHSTEVASTLTAMEFAWKLASGASPKLRQVLDNVIVILAPSINPDGVDIVANWYKRTLGTPFEGTSPPELYQKYIGHDNNRDWYIFSQAETRAVVSQLHNAWHPQIVYDVHQMGSGAARIFVPPWMDPIDPNVDPVIAQQSNMLGMGMAADLTAAGRKGVAVNAAYDFWTPGRHYQSYHGGMRILSESASARLFSPLATKTEELDSSAPGYSPRERSWNHLEPWPGGTWRVRDIMDDQLIAMESLCWQAAVRREDLLRNFYGINRRAMERQPYAYVVPAMQRDPSAARKLLETLDFGAVEIERADSPITFGNVTWPTGSYVIRMQQPWSAWAKTLLERQTYPDLRLYPGGPPKRPYDVTAQTLPLLMGVDVESVSGKIEEPLARSHEFRFAAAKPVEPEILSASDGDAWKRVTEAWKSGSNVYRMPTTGDFRLTPAAGFEPVKKPRVGLYRSFIPNMDEGWTRWIFEQFGWPYESVGNQAIRGGGRLSGRYDVIIFADQRSAAIANGYAPGSMPPEYTGGLGAAGAEALKQFLADGGRLIFLNQSGGYAASQLGIKVRDSLEGVSAREVYCPGSLLNVQSESADLALAGVPGKFTVWNESSPVWVPLEGAQAKVHLRYPSAGVLASGWLLGEKYYAGKPALLEVRAGQGRVYLFGMRPQYRAQSLLTLKLLFNAMAQ